MLRSGPLFWAAALACVAGCAYPRRATPLSSLPRDAVSTQDAPSDLWRVVLVSADVPQRQRSGLAWDEGDGAPDPYLKLMLEGRTLWESTTLDDQNHPTWNAAPPKNLAFDRNAKLRIELWDRDGISADPIGIYEGRAFSEAILDAETIIKLEGGATVTMRLERPEPHAGTGLASYELRRDALLILEVIPNSPASRAGLAPGDRIRAINDRQIDELGPQKAESALALAAQQDSELLVERDGKYRRVKLDHGYVWLSM